jgi:S-DNA-T family DNA segregation ATPase FtsK/SpoIIIE
VQGCQPKPHRPQKVSQYFLLGLALSALISGFVQIWFGDALRTKDIVKICQQFYREGQDTPFLHGGAISIFLAYPFSAWIGKPGDKICIIILLFLVVMWLMNWDMRDLWHWCCKMGRKCKKFLLAEENTTLSEDDVPEFAEETGKKPSFFSRFRRKTEPELEATDMEATDMEADAFLQTFSQMPTEEDFMPEPEPLPEPEPPFLEPFQMDIPVTAAELAQEPTPVSSEKPPVTKKTRASSTYQLPNIRLLRNGTGRSQSPEIRAELERNKERLQRTLRDFNVNVTMKDALRGPSVTRYEIQPQAGVKVSKITGLADDIALSLAAQSVRIEAPIPGKSAVGVEVPNTKKDTVMLRDILESPAFQCSKSKLSFAVGRNIAGEAIVGDIAKMPHLIIAGATGSGKSVCTNSIIMSILFHATPDEVRLILIDPKIVEFRVYENIPHLLIPVVTDPKKAAGALNWAVQEMERRYQLFADNGVRDLADFNRKASQQPALETLPQIVIAIDELADLMMTASKEVEDAICRLAQKARAAGMHLIIATQRPTTDIITGLIKANIPSRIALSVMSQVDSRTILDMGGAEKLLGHGDMLYLPNGMPKPIRLQGCYVSTEEIEATVDFIKQQAQTTYDAQILEGIEQNIPVTKGERNSAESSHNDNKDPMLEEAIAIVVEFGQASTSSLQRHLKLGYARAARIMDELEKMGIIGPYDGAKPRKVLMTKQQYEERKMRHLP